MKCHATILIAAGIFAFAATGSAFAIGALAVDDYDDESPADAGYGSVTGYNSKREASMAALDSCRSSPTSDCKLVLTFTKCGAYAASRNTYGVGTGNTVDAAEKRALTDCGDAGCMVVVSDCE
jgi:hypothetical protein